MRSIGYYIRNPRRAAVAVVKHLVWLPDATYLKLLYFFEMGEPLHLKNPRTFQEKIQWLKLNDRKPEYTTLVDKYAVKQYVSDKIGEEHVIPTIGVWDSVDDIDFDSLPQKFVLKTTHGGGGNGVIICKDKSTFDVSAAKAKLHKALKADIYSKLREWPYKNVQRRIIAEQLLEVKGHKDLPDYKVFCFNGEPKFIQVIQNRHTDETIDFFDVDWKHQNFTGLAYNRHKTLQSRLPIARPTCLDDMLKVARYLANGTDFVRVDLYNCNDRYYFGEVTFYPASGLGTFLPDEYNIILGNMLNIKGSSMGGGKLLTINAVDDVVEVHQEINDYKFFCFNGEPRFLKVDFGRFIEHHANYYDLEWNLLPFGEEGLNPDPSHEFLPPPNFKMMIELARRLSAEHPFLRVDFYNVAGKILFGELTFFPASGFGPFTPAEWNSKIGQLIKL